MYVQYTGLSECIGWINLSGNVYINIQSRLTLQQTIFIIH